ncbi:MAG: hypothetical protein ABEL04_01270 [Salinibacter sp.]|uniref:hypothetical protein n=1 Tax=Salinibacter sp. TaxID=2065818 RepID=UPI0035D407B1
MSSEEEHIPSPPSPVAPRDATAVNGDEVTFVWEDIDEAELYRLQVAPTARFEDPVVDAEVGAETAVTVGNQLPTDGQTLFWRVLSGTEAGWSKGGSVGSFIATTEAEASPPLPSDEGEPTTELARSAQRGVEVESFDFEDQFEKEKERGVAYEGVAAGQIMGISASIIAVILVAAAVIFGWFEQVSQNAQTTAVGQQDYQQIRQAEREAAEQLRQYGVVNRKEGVYHIPIDSAMKIIAAEEYVQQAQQSEPSQAQ